MANQISFLLTFSLHETKDHTISFKRCVLVGILPIPAKATFCLKCSSSDLRVSPNLGKPRHLAPSSRLNNQIEKMRGQILIKQADLHVSRDKRATKALKSLSHINWSQDWRTGRSCAIIRIFGFIELVVLARGIVLRFFA